jgi:hypothetical protein
VRRKLQLIEPAERHSDLSDRDAIDRCVERVVIHPKSIEIGLRKSGVDEVTERDSSAAGSHVSGLSEQTAMAAVITVPWDAPRPASVKGILDQPSRGRRRRPTQSHDSKTDPPALNEDGVR